MWIVEFGQVAIFAHVGWAEDSGGSVLRVVKVHILPHRGCCNCIQREARPRFNLPLTAYSEADFKENMV
jgi:hypothetical protein